MSEYLSQRQNENVNALLGRGQVDEAYALAVTYINEGDASRPKLPPHLAVLNVYRRGLGFLRAKRIITDEQFETKKREMLDHRIRPSLVERITPLLQTRPFDARVMNSLYGISGVTENQAIEFFNSVADVFEQLERESIRSDRLYRTISRERNRLPKSRWTDMHEVPLQAPFAPSNPDLICTNPTTLMGDEAGQVILEDLVFMMVNDDTSALYCYNRDDFSSWMEHELSKGIRIHSALEWVPGCKRPGDTPDARILLDSYTGLFIDGLIQTLYRNHHCRAFILVKRGHFFIESSFDVGTIHDRDVDVYTAVPIEFNILAGLRGTDAIREYKRRLNFPSTCVDDTRILIPLEVYQELMKRADGRDELIETVEDVLRLGEEYGMDLRSYVREVRKDERRLVNDRVQCTPLSNWMGRVDTEFGVFGRILPEYPVGEHADLGLKRVTVPMYGYPRYSTQPRSGWSETFKGMWMFIQSITREVRNESDAGREMLEAKRMGRETIIVMNKSRTEFSVIYHNIVDWRYVIMTQAFYTWNRVGVYQPRTCLTLSTVGNRDFIPNTFQDIWLDWRGCRNVYCNDYISENNFRPPHTLSFQTLKRLETEREVVIADYPNSTVKSILMRDVTNQVRVSNVGTYVVDYSSSGQDTSQSERTLTLEINAENIGVLDLSSLAGYRYILNTSNIGRVIMEN